MNRLTFLKYITAIPFVHKFTDLATEEQVHEVINQPDNSVICAIKYKGEQYALGVLIEDGVIDNKAYKLIEALHSAMEVQLRMLEYEMPYKSSFLVTNVL